MLQASRLPPGDRMNGGSVQGWTCDLETIDDLVWYAPRKHLRSALIAGVEAVWTELCQGDPLPRKSAIDPIDFKPWLPYLSLIEIHDHPFRIRYRLVGTETARFGGEDYTGKWLDETGWPPGIQALNLALYKRLFDTARPVFGFAATDWRDRRDCLFEWALYPFGDATGRIAYCLSADDFSTIAPRTALLRESDAVPP